MEVEIGRGKKGRRAYGFDEIAIVPSRRTRDAEDVDITWKFGPFTLPLPCLASAMDGVVDPQFAVTMGKLGGLAVLNLEGVQTRYENADEQLDRIAALPKESATRTMQEIYREPIKPELVAKWLEQRTAELLPTDYFHVVFTLPEEIAAIAFYNQEVVYDMLFRTVAETLLSITGDPQRLGVETGFFTVLHTWGQNLHFHPHLHCVVPGGGLSPDHDRWIAGRRKFLLPVKVLSARFRRLFLQALAQAHAKGQLQFFSDLGPLADPTAFARYLAPLQFKKWVVYAKAPFGGPQHVLEYRSEER